MIGRTDRLLSLCGFLFLKMSAGNSSSSPAQFLIVPTLAATTVQQSQFSSDPESSSVPPPHTWSDCSHETFLLRSGQNYSKNQEKSPSPPPIMELVGVDIVRCESRVDHIASYLELHPEWRDVETHHPLIPPIFVMNAQVREKSK